MWSYANNGKWEASVSFEEIVNLIKTGVILPETEVCEIGQNSCDAEKHPKLVSLFQKESVNQTSKQENNTNPKSEPSDNSVCNVVTKKNVSITEPIKRAWLQFKYFIGEKSKSKIFVGLVILGGGTLQSGVMFAFLLITLISGGFFVSADKYYQQALDYQYEEDEVNATRCFKRAALRGHAEAQYRLGLQYSLGLGVKEDHVKAAKWYLKSANQGNAEAQDSLGMCYLVGQGVPRDEEKFQYWSAKAKQTKEMEGCSDPGCYFPGNSAKADDFEEDDSLTKRPKYAPYSPY